MGNEPLPKILVDFISGALAQAPGSLVLHQTSKVSGYKDKTVREEIKRSKGFMGSTQLEQGAFPNGRHHVRIFRNEAGKARVFYKYKGVSFAQNKKVGQ